MTLVDGAIWTPADRIRKARETSGRSIAEMAAALGLGRNTVSRWENGRIQPAKRDLLAYQIVTGFSAEWLADGSGEPIERTRRDSNSQPSDLESSGIVIPWPAAA